MRAKLTKRFVDALASSTRLYVYDADLRGFGVSVSPSGAKTFLAQYRTPGGRRGVSRRVVIGKHSTLTVEEARVAARRILAAAAQGEDPSATRAAMKVAPTVQELGAEYLLDVGAR